MSPVGRSLRWRLALTIAIIAALLSTGIGIAVYARTQRDQLARARDSQAARAVLAAGLVRNTGQTLVGAEIDTPRAPPALRRAVERGRLATYRTEEPRAAIWAGMPLEGRSDPPGRGIYVSGSFAADERTLSALRRTLLLVGVLGTVVAAILGAALASGLSRRLRRAAGVADRVAAGDYHARINAAGRDEVARLAHAVDQMADALGARLERERRFSADAAHELRTPLTALTSAAELLGDERPAQIVRSRVGALRRLVDDLLELSHLDTGQAQPGAPEALELGPWMERLVAERAPDAVLQLEAPARVWTDPRRLERIVGNLLDNAARHGKPPVVVRVEGTAIEVRDHGAGFPSEMLEHGPRRFWTGSGARGSGSGLGLTIAAGHARIVGADLTFANVDPSGAVARLRIRQQGDAHQAPDTPVTEATTT